MKRIALIAICSWLVSAGAFASETGPVIVIPGKPGVPVIINGVDVSYAVVEGDWGLARPSYTAPTVIYRPFYPSDIGPPPSAYFPKTGRAPRYGRLERDVPRPPEPAQSYKRSWGVESQPTPSTIMPPEYMVPPVIVDPDLRRRHRP